VRGASTPRSSIRRNWALHQVADVVIGAVSSRAAGRRSGPGDGQDDAAGQRHRTLIDQGAAPKPAGRPRSTIRRSRCDVALLRAEHEPNIARTASRVLDAALPTSRPSPSRPRGGPRSGCRPGGHLHLQGVRPPGRWRHLGAPHESPAALRGGQADDLAERIPVEALQRR
jgi:hypothetical protein